MRFKRWMGLLTALCLLAAVAAMPAETARAAAKYYITVDITNQVVTVYDNGNTSESGIVCRMICSTGKSGTPTPTGTYTLPTKTYSTERTEWYYFPKYNCYAKWATRIVGGILFHSVLFTSGKSGPTSSSVSALGSRASHGCVRLRVNDAKWIAQNCPAGTRCRVYYSGNPDADLRRRLLDHSFYRSKESYEEFLGYEETGFRILTRGMSGDRVSQIQARLKALGFLNDVVDGDFGPNTESAVKYFQKACKVKRTGKVNEALWNRAFAGDAPTGTYVTLSEGQSGPATAVLQRGLTSLKLYDGDADGVYDGEVAAAVRAFQGYYGYAANGKADQKLQKDVISRAKKLKKRFGDGEYRLVVTKTRLSMGRVKDKSSVKLMAGASGKSEALAKLKKGTEVEVDSKGKTWTAVRHDGTAGYIKTKYLKFFKRTQKSLSYVAAADPDPTPTPTPEVSLPTATPTPTPEVSLPTATPTPTPEISLPTATPTPTPTPTPASDDVVSALEDSAVREVDALLGEDDAPRWAVVLADGTALYAGPEADADAVLQWLSAGDALEVEGLRDGWIAARRGEVSGYVALSDATLTDELPGDMPADRSENAGGELEMGTEPTPEPIDRPEDAPALVSGE